MINPTEEMKKLYNEFPSILVDMVYNRPLVFVVGCFVGLPAWLIGLKERFVDWKEGK